MSASTQVFVVSDLHLGGPAGFRMCSPEGAARLAQFVEYVTAQEGDVHLVLAGDVVDLLAEPDAPAPAPPRWSAFVSDQAAALAKVTRVLESTADVWQALGKLVAKGHALTVMLGNHDIEVALPRVRAALLEKLGAGRVSLLHDNEAFTLGKLIVEHGNRYDPWNAVDHDGLRRVRSALSRAEDAARADFEVQPGSELVAQVMNRIKLKYAFVDLLKPETAGVLPILAVLDPAVWLEARAAVQQLARAAWRRRLYDAEGRPTGELIRASGREAAPPAGGELVRAAAAPPPEPMLDEDALNLADVLAREAGGGRADERVGVKEVVRKLEVKLLLRAFRSRAEKDLALFRVTEEAEPYAGGARRLVKDGKFQVVVFGHTHHAKRVSIGGATYLNTGTWADLMRLPPAVYAGPDAAGLAALEVFLADVGANDLGRYRRQVATYARVVVGPGEGRDRDVLERELFFFDGPDKEPKPVDEAGVLERLAPGER